MKIPMLLLMAVLSGNVAFGAGPGQVIYSSELIPDLLMPDSKWVPSRYECYLYLNSITYNYVMELSDTFDDQIMVSTISVGRFTANGDEYTFTDRATNAILKTKKISDGSLKFTAGFKFLLRVEAFRVAGSSYDGEFDRYENELAAKSLSYAQAAEIRKKETQSGNVPKFYPGYYRDDGFCLVLLSSDHTFKMCKRNFIFSRGRWKQEGNLIVFSDPYIKHDFYSLVYKDHIKSMLLPGGSSGQGAVMKRVSKIPEF